MPETLERQSTPASNVRPIHLTAGVALVAVAGVLFWALLVPALSGHARVTITVENPTDYAVAVAVSDGSGSELGLGVAPPNKQRQFHDVIDQGRSWQISFSYGGVEGGSVSATRAELERSGSVEVPMSVARELAGAGLEPSA